MPGIVYMGTPTFAVPALRALLEEGYEIAGVFTQPDRPAGRTRQPRPSPVKEIALQHGLPLWQPPRLRGEVVDSLRALSPAVIVVAAYGEILRPEVLAIPTHGCLNIHASLLPRHRGASPIAAAILAGDTATGITLMQMDTGMDTGPIVAQEVIALDGMERQGQLLEQMADVGAGLLRRVLPDWLAGAMRPQPQDESQATYCGVIRKEDGAIDWSRPAVQIERMTRAYDPWPGAYTWIRGRRLRIWQAQVMPPAGRPAPGEIRIQDERLLVGTGEGGLLLEQVQLEGKGRLPAAEFARGWRDLDGVRLG